MKFADPWLDWEPTQKQVVNYAKGSPLKPAKPHCEGFVGDPFRQALTTFNLEAEPAACEEFASRWLVEHCSTREQLWWAVRVLHRAYCEWCDHEGHEVRAGLDAFRWLLLEKGFTLTKDDLVYGLVPTKDFLALDKNLVAVIQG